VPRWCSGFCRRRGLVVGFPMVLGFAWFFACAALVRLCAYGVGLSLHSWWFISVPPVRGGTYFSLPAAKKSRQKKAARSPC
jgi:hypothetical protein